MATPFTPKQAIPFNAADFVELQGDVTDVIARELLQELPPLHENSVVHDNGCGPGTCALAIMENNPPAGIQIHATDINPTWMEALKTKLAENPSWPVKTDIMDACNLTFADDTFDLSLSTFIFVALPDQVSAAKHILRTLKPRGTAAVAVWQDLAWDNALQTAHHKTRGDDEPMPPYLGLWRGYKEKFEQVAKDAGWRNVQWIEKPAYLTLGVDMRRWAALAWSFLAHPVGGWKQQDEDMWDEAIDVIVAELEKSERHKVEDGLHKIRMDSAIAIVKK